MTQPSAVELSYAPRAVLPLRIDPRTKLLGLFVVNSIAYSSGSLTAQAFAAALVAALLAQHRDRRAVTAFAVTYLLSAVAYLVLPVVASGWFTGMLVVFGFWIARFAVTLGYFAYFVLTTGVGELNASLAALRVPRLLSVPIAVVIRFIPTVIDELRAIFDAMRLRGIATGPISVAAHPVRTARHVMLPLLASTSRIADELSAAALIRGLGRAERPTTVTCLRFGLGDAALIVALLLLVAFAAMPEGTPWLTL